MYFQVILMVLMTLVIGAEAGAGARNKGNVKGGSILTCAGKPINWKLLTDNAETCHAQSKGRESNDTKWEFFVCMLQAFEILGQDGRTLNSEKFRKLMSKILPNYGSSIGKEIEDNVIKRCFTIEFMFAQIDVMAKHFELKNPETYEDFCICVIAEVDQLINPVKRNYWGLRFVYRYVDFPTPHRKVQKQQKSSSLVFASINNL